MESFVYKYGTLDIGLTREDFELSSEVYLDSKWENRINESGIKHRIKVVKEAGPKDQFLSNVFQNKTSGLIYKVDNSKNEKFTNPPSAGKIPLITEAYPTEKHKNHRKVYGILLARSLQNNGLTKINNNRIAQILDISGRQVTNIIADLEKKGFIACHVVTKPSVKKFDGRKRGCTSDRLIKVWLGLALNGGEELKQKDLPFANHTPFSLKKMSFDLIGLDEKEYEIGLTIKNASKNIEKIKKGDMYELMDVGSLGLVDRWFIDMYPEWINQRDYAPKGNQGLEVLGYKRKLALWRKRKAQKIAYANVVRRIKHVIKNGEKIKEIEYIPKARPVANGNYDLCKYVNPKLYVRMQAIDQFGHLIPNVIKMHFGSAKAAFDQKDTGKIYEVFKFLHNELVKLSTSEILSNEKLHLKVQAKDFLKNFKKVEFGKSDIILKGAV